MAWTFELTEGLKNLKIMAESFLKDIPTLGNVYFVFNSTNTYYTQFSKVHNITYPDGTSAVHTSLATAIAACTSGRNDVILLDANSSHSTAMITMSKSRVHIVGMDGGGRKNSQGAKISTPATDVVASVAVISNTGTRNTFTNIKFIQQGTNVAQTSAFIDTGEGTYCKNCGFEVNSILTTATQGLLFKGDTCHYEDCQIGNSTVYHTAANQAPLVIQTPARYSYFVNCEIINYSDKTTASLVDAPDADSVIGWVKFNNCALICANLGDWATAGATIAEGVTSICTSGYLLFDNNCTAFAVGKFAKADASILNASGVAVAAAAGWLAIAWA